MRISFNVRMNASSRYELCTFVASDGYRWYYRRYPAVGRPRGRIVAIHGIRSHGGWYTRSCEAFAAAGYDVYFLDRRGSGLNTAHRGDTPNFRRLLDDLGEFLRDLRLSQPWLPIHLLAVSWGSKLAVGLPYRHPGLVHSLVLACPGLCAKVSPTLGQRIAIGRARVRQPSKRFPIPLNEPDLFTASPEWQSFIAAEPHDLRTATARFLFSSVSLDIYLKRAAKRVTVPTLLLLAGEDKIIDNARTRKMVEAFPTTRRDVIEYASAAHTLEFEPPGHPFVADVLAWWGAILSPGRESAGTARP